MYTYSFEKLEVWKLSRKMVKSIYLLTKGFPDEEKFGITSQIRRVVVSISNNLAEGTSRKTMKDQSHFTVMAYGSLLEVLNMTMLALDLEFIDEDKYLSIRPEMEELGNKLNAFRNSQLAR